MLCEKFFIKVTDFEIFDRSKKSPADQKTKNFCSVT